MAMNLTSQRLAVMGSILYDRIMSEKVRHYIGERVTFYRHGNLYDGRILEIHPNLFLIKTENYNMSITWIDYVLQSMNKEEDIT